MENINKYVTLISEKTGQSEKIVKNVLIGIVAFILVLGFGACLTANLVGVFFPAFQSFKALQSENADDSKRWLTYWIVFSGFSIGDHFTSFILSWIPFYFLLKLVFLVYLFHPVTDGANMIMRKYILPNVKKYLD